MRTVLFAPDLPPEQQPAPGIPTPVALAAPAAPPAAVIVTTGTRTERETALEAELETERGSHVKTAKEKKERELRIAELEDELHKLKNPPGPKAQKRSFMDVSEFFEG